MSGLDDARPGPGPEDFPALELIADGVVPEQWRRGIALLAVAQLATARGEYLTTVHAVKAAGRVSTWIETGVLPDA